MLGLMVMPLANTSGHQGLLLSIARGTSIDRARPLRPARRARPRRGARREPALRHAHDVPAPLGSRGAGAAISRRSSPSAAAATTSTSTWSNRFRALPARRRQPGLLRHRLRHDRDRRPGDAGLPRHRDGRRPRRRAAGHRLPDRRPRRRPVAPGEVGELELRGPNVTPRLLERPRSHRRRLPRRLAPHRRPGPRGQRAAPPRLRRPRQGRDHLRRQHDLPARDRARAARAPRPWPAPPSSAFPTRCMGEVVVAAVEPRPGGHARRGRRYSPGCASRARALSASARDPRHGAPDERGPQGEAPARERDPRTRQRRLGKKNGAALAAPFV